MTINLKKPFGVISEMFFYVLTFLSEIKSSIRFTFDNAVSIPNLAVKFYAKNIAPFDSFFSL